MKIFPAIDIIDGNVVRLTKGDYNVKKQYSVSPEQIAQKFYEDGARFLHVVDLDGAKVGKAVNAEVIGKIIRKSPMFIEVGGGIRTLSQIENYLNSGASRVIIGTAAVNDKSFLMEAIKKYGDKIAVGVDANNGLVAVNGWQEVTQINSVDFCKQLKDVGVKNIIYTDISKDGALKGTNLEIYKVLCQIEHVNFTASGGITYLEEIDKLAKIGVDAAIVGKAIYEGKLDLKKVSETAEANYAG